MSWFTTGASILAILLAANAVWSVRRPARRDAGPKRLTFIGAVLYTVLVVCLLAPLAAPVLVPSSAFAQGMASWIAVASFAMWCVFAIVVAQTALALAGLPSWRSSTE